MTDATSRDPGAIGPALGRLPSGLYILTTTDGDRSTGMLASWVQQAGFAPPMVTVALGKGRYVADWVAGSGRFVLNQVAAGDKALLRHFGRGFPAEAPAFEGVALAEPAGGGPVLATALAFLDCEVAGQVEAGDHRIVVGRVVGGGLLHAEGEPMVHIRRDGSHY